MHVHSIFHIRQLCTFMIIIHTWRHGGCISDVHLMIQMVSGLAGIIRAPFPPSYHQKLRICLTTSNEGSVGEVQQAISLTFFGMRNGQSALKISFELYKIIINHVFIEMDEFLEIFFSFLFFPTGFCSLCTHCHFHISFSSTIVHIPPHPPEMKTN